MEIKALQIKSEFSQEKKLTEKMLSFQQLITELNKKDIPVDMATSFNRDIEEMNQFAGTVKATMKLLGKKQDQIVTRLEKELKLVTINHYRDQWLALGTSAFGLPIGVAFGLSMGNLGLLGIGLPIGLGIGVLVGARMDKKAKAAGRLLDVALK